MTIKRSDIDLIALHTAGQKALQAEHDLQEQSKIGTLRGGSSGCVTEDGRVVGKCHRVAHLRSLGLQEDTTSADQIMFAAGYANEDIWYAHLSKSWQGIILREEEIPISWLTQNGTVVSGRPDMVLCNADSVPQLGLEFKLISSPFTAYNIAVKNLPNLDHVIQASHYMGELQVPFKLLYTSRTNHSTGYGAMKNKWISEAGVYLDEEQKIGRAHV